MDYEGQERRKVDRDWLERDRMLSEIHTDVKYVMKWIDEHDRADDKRFDKISGRISIIEKVCYCGIGGFAIIELFFKFLK